MNRPRILCCFVTSLALSAPHFALAQAKRALLVGINTYSPTAMDTSGNKEQSHPVAAGDKQSHPADSRFSGTVSWQNLEGPENDVRSIAAVLPQFGFKEINQLTGQSATREAILAAVDKYIIAEPKAGDTVLFYFAGHGSQRFNSKSPKIDHLDETIVPADAYKGAFDIRDKELARKFNQAIDKGIHIVAIFDSCHSGTMARGVKVGVARWLPYDDRDAADSGDYGTGARQAEPPARRGAIIVSAALSTQSADEVSGAEADSSEAHGVFTHAFTRTLRSATPAWTALDLVNSTDALLKADGWTQQPTVEGAVNRQLFGDFTITGIRATVRDVTPQGLITLNAGSASGFGPGSEFESKSGTVTKLEVTQITGPASSRAKITSGRVENIHPGDLFGITRFAVPPEAKLTVFVPGIVSSEELGRIRTQVGNLQSSAKWTLASDPVLELPSNLVYWTSAGWTVTTPQGTSTNIGGTLTTDAISKVVENGAKVYVSIPPSHSLIDALKQESGVATGALDLTNAVLTASQYILIGRVSKERDGDVEYALVLPRLFGALDPATLARSENTNGKTVICSSDSELPLRSDWVLGGTEHERITTAANEIASIALKLGRSRSWLVAGAHNSSRYWPYRLVVTQNDQPLSNTPLAAGTAYDINLVADAAKLASQVVEPQYVYLFGLQCDGAGVLLYPSAELGGGAPLPVLLPDHRFPERINVAHQEVTPPVGLDTIVMLITPERIADLSAFSYSGVVTRGVEARGVGDSAELEELVRSISGQGRGVGLVSATWSIQRASIRSH